MKCKINTNIQPLFDTEELAKIYYETDVLAKGRFSVMAESGSLIVLKQQWLNKGFLLTDEPCLFKDEDGNCRLGDMRPKFCKDIEKELESGKDIKLIVADRLNDTISLPMLKSIKNTKNIRRIKPFTRKDLKNIKFDSVFYYLVHIFQNIDYKNSDIPVVYKPEYMLTLIEDKRGNRVSAIKVFNAVTNLKQLDSPIKLYNKFNKMLLAKDYDYIKLIIDRLNRLISGIAKISIDEELLEQSDKYVNNKIKASNNIRFAQWLLMLSKLASKSKIPYIKRYVSDLEDKLSLMNYMVIYYVNNSLTNNLMELKDNDEISFKDLIPTNPLVKEVLEELENVTETVIKVISTH